MGRKASYYILNITISWNQSSSLGNDKHRWWRKEDARCEEEEFTKIKLFFTLFRQWKFFQPVFFENQIFFHLLRALFVDRKRDMHVTFIGSWIKRMMKIKITQRSPRGILYFLRHCNLSAKFHRPMRKFKCPLRKKSNLSQRFKLFSCEL